MKTAYKFNSKHLGQAFFKELLGMGYEKHGYWEYSDSCYCIISPFTDSYGKNSVAFCNHDGSNVEKTFKLETQWKEALEFAKAELDKPEFEVGGYFGFDKKGEIKIGRIDKIKAGKFDGWNITDDNAWVGRMDWLRRDCFAPTKEQIKEATTKPIEVNGYEAEFHDGYVKFGCAKIDNAFFTKADKLRGFVETGKGNRLLTGVKIGEGLFDIETIKEINKRLK